MAKLNLGLPQQRAQNATPCMICRTLLSNSTMKAISPVQALPEPRPVPPQPLGVRLREGSAKDRTRLG